MPSQKPKSSKSKKEDKHEKYAKSVVKEITDLESGKIDSITLDKNMDNLYEKSK